MPARTLIAAGLCLAILSLPACSKPGSEGADANQAAANSAVTEAELENTDFYTSLPTKEFMGHVMQYTADGIWKRQGFVQDASGERSLFPTDDEGWEEAESAGLSLATMTNELLLPGRKVNDPEWTAAVKRVRAVALDAAKAAEKQDKDAFFDAGSRLDEACESCHVRFIPNYVGPGAAAGNAAAANSASSNSN